METKKIANFWDGEARDWIRESCFLTLTETDPRDPVRDRRIVISSPFLAGDMPEGIEGEEGMEAGAEIPTQCDASESGDGTAQDGTGNKDKPRRRR